MCRQHLRFNPFARLCPALDRLNTIARNEVFIVRNFYFFGSYVYGLCLDPSDPNLTRYLHPPLEAGESHLLFLTPKGEFYSAGPCGNSTQLPKGSDVLAKIRRLLPDGTTHSGRYSVVTTREVESEADFERLSSMPQIVAIAPLNRILLPANLDSIKSLREASARLKADILLIYTFDTSFHAGEQKFAPLNVISLGFLKNKEVAVTTTVSAAFFDVRTEYLFGLAEATAKESKNSSVWSTSAAVDDMRVATEKEAFQMLLPEIGKTWSGIISQYSSKGG